MADATYGRRRSVVGDAYTTAQHFTAQASPTTSVESNVRLLQQRRGSGVYASLDHGEAHPVGFSEPTPEVNMSSVHARRSIHATAVLNHDAPYEMAAPSSKAMPEGRAAQRRGSGAFAAVDPSSPPPQGGAQQSIAMTIHSGHQRRGSGAYAALDATTAPPPPGPEAGQGIAMTELSPYFHSGAVVAAAVDTTMPPVGDPAWPSRGQTIHSTGHRRGSGVYASLDTGEPPPQWGVHVDRGRGMTDLSQFQRSGAGAQAAIDVTSPVPHTEPEPRRRQSSVQGGEQRRGNVIFGTAADTGGGMPPEVEVRHFGTTYHSVAQRRGSGVKEAMDVSLPLPEPQSLVERAAALAAVRDGSSSGPPAAGRSYMAVRPGAASGLDGRGSAAARPGAASSLDGRDSGGARGGAASSQAGASNMDSLAEFAALRALGLPTVASGTARSGGSHSSHPADISATVAAAIARVPTQMGGEREPDYGAPPPYAAAAAGTGGYGVGLNYGGPGGGNTNPRFLGPNPPEHVIHGRRGSGVYSSLDMSEAPPPVEQQVTDHARRAQTDLSAAYRSGAGVAAQLDPALAAPPPCAPDNRAQTIHSGPQRRGSGVYAHLDPTVPAVTAALNPKQPSRAQSVTGAAQRRGSAAAQLLTPDGRSVSPPRPY